jgi:hypothetical protein
LILVEENMVRRQHGIANVAFHVRPQVFSRRAAGIPIYGAESEVVQSRIFNRFPKIIKPISADESALIGNQRFFDKLSLSLDGEPLATREQSIATPYDQQTDLNEHRWRVPAFIFGVFLFSASFLLGVESAERTAQLSVANRNAWSWLSLLYDVGLFVGAFLMLIGPQIF